MEPTLYSILTNFGTFGLALVVVGSSFWIVWKRIIGPQQEELRKRNEEHIQTLRKIAEEHGNTTQKFVDLVQENISALKELNGNIATHHAQMHTEHKMEIDAIKNIKRRK